MPDADLKNHCEQLPVVRIQEDNTAYDLLLTSREHYLALPSWLTDDVAAHPHVQRLADSAVLVAAIEQLLQPGT